MNREVRWCIIMVLAMVALPSRPSAQQSVRAAAGCYRVTIGPWNRRLNGFYVLPSVVMLDTIAIDSTGRWRLRPNLNYPYPRSMRGYPHWTLSDNKLGLVWTDGYTPTVVKLKPMPFGWKGTAEAHHHIPSLWPWRKPPRASVQLTKESCA